jgi:DNA-binding response OmpR family regulator
MAEAIFSAMKFSVSSADNVSKAKKWLASNTPKLIVLDIMMPDGNGLDMCRWIRLQPGLKDIPVLVASALADEETLQDALEAGATDFIHKPYNHALFQEKMERLRIKP